MATTSFGALITAWTKPLGTTTLQTTVDVIPAFNAPTELDQFKRVNELEETVLTGIKAVTEKFGGEELTGSQKPYVVPNIDLLPREFPLGINAPTPSLLTEVFWRVNPFHQTLARALYYKTGSGIPEHFAHLRTMVRAPENKLVTLWNYKTLLNENRQALESVVMKEMGERILPKQWIKILSGERIFMAALKTLEEAERALREKKARMSYCIKSELLEKVIWERILGGQKDFLREIDRLYHIGFSSPVIPVELLMESQLWLNARIVSDIKQVRDEIFTILGYKDRILSQWAGGIFDYAYVTDITPKSNPYAKLNIAALTPERLNKVIQQILGTTYFDGIPDGPKSVYMEDPLYTVESYDDLSYPNCCLYTDLETKQKFRIRRVDRSSHDRSILLGQFAFKHLTSIYRVQHSVCAIKVPTEMPNFIDSVPGGAAMDGANGMLRTYGDKVTVRKDHIWLIEENLPLKAMGNSNQLSVENAGPVALGGISGIVEMSKNKLDLPFVLVESLRGRPGPTRPVFKIDTLYNVVFYDKLSSYREHQKRILNETLSERIYTFHDSLIKLRPEVGEFKSLIDVENIGKLAEHFNITLNEKTEDLVKGHNLGLNLKSYRYRSDIFNIQDDSEYRPPDVYGHPGDPYWEEPDDEVLFTRGSTTKHLPIDLHTRSAAAPMQAGPITGCLNFFKRISGLN